MTTSKNCVYKPRHISALRRRTLEVCEQTTPEAFQNMLEQLELKVYHCYTDNDGLFVLT